MNEVESTLKRIAPYVRRTPCRRSVGLSDLTGGEVHLKLENLQETGSFKLRGVVSKVLSLSEEQKRSLVVAASTGNHGMAFAHAVEIFGLRGRLFIPRTASKVKVDVLRSTGIPFEPVGENCVEAEEHAHAFARDGGHVWISPYNDVEVVRGQGTVAVELTAQMDAFDTVLVPVGGGGLIAGIASYLKTIRPEVRIIGCQPRNSCVMAQSVEAGEIIEAEEEPTISDGTAGGIEAGSVTFELCRQFVDEFILLDESDIERAIRWVHEREGMAVEGAASLSVGAVLKHPRRFSGRTSIAVLSGCRIDPALLERLGCRGEQEVEP